MDDEQPLDATRDRLQENVHHKHEHRLTLPRLTPFPLLATLPNELLLHIFTYLNTNDLSHVSRSCWTFYNLSIKGLLRHLTWSANSRSTFSSMIWNNSKPEYDRVPVSLTLSGLRTNAFTHLYDRFRTFTSLRTIQFANFDLSGSPIVYEILANFPNLRTLSFLKCTLPACSSEVAATLADLPLEELDMMFITWELASGGANGHHHYPHGHLVNGGLNVPIPAPAHGPVVPPPANVAPPIWHTWGPPLQAFAHFGAPGGPAASNAAVQAILTAHHNQFAHLFIPQHPPPQPAPFPAGVVPRYAALNLTSARNLKVLRLDWTDAIAMYVFNEKTMHNPFSIANLHTLELRGLDEGKIMGGSVHEYLMLTVRLLRGCPRLERLGMMPDVRLKRLPLPPALNSLHTFHGPLDTLQVFKIQNNVRHIVAVNEINVSRLPYHLPASLPVLESMELKLPAWDIEILHCAVQVFPTVKDLRIKYYGAADPDSVCSNHLYSER